MFRKTLLINVLRPVGEDSQPPRDTLVSNDAAVLRSASQPLRVIFLYK